MITYCRVRPARAIGPAWAETCRREGTTTVEAAAPSAAEVTAALSVGLLPVGGPGATGVAGWVAAPAEAESLGARGVPGWRITVADRGGRQAAGEALRRTGAAYLRTGRSRVSAAVSLARGTGAVVSVFADTVGQAPAAVAAGAGDLLLRDWDTERLGQLRDALAGRLLVERGAFPPGVAYADAADALDPAVLRAYLDLVDASGVVRPRNAWAPGRDLPLPVAPGRLSAEWADPSQAGEATPAKTTR